MDKINEKRGKKGIIMDGKNDKVSNIVESFTHDKKNDQK